MKNIESQDFKKCAFYYLKCNTHLCSFIEPNLILARGGGKRCYLSSGTKSWCEFYIVSMQLDFS